MIRRIEGLADGVVGFEAVGRVTADDYQSVLIPDVDRASEGDAKARVLIVFGPDFEGYEAEAALDDMKMGLHNWGDFERIAFVTDHTAYRGIVRGVGFLMPGQVKVFTMAELDDAKSWVAG